MDPSKRKSVSRSSSSLRGSTVDKAELEKQKQNIKILSSKLPDTRKSLIQLNKEKQDVQHQAVELRKELAKIMKEHDIDHIGAKKHGFVIQCKLTEDQFSDEDEIIDEINDEQRLRQYCFKKGFKPANIKLSKVTRDDILEVVMEMYGAEKAILVDKEAMRLNMEHWKDATDIKFFNAPFKTNKKRSIHKAIQNDEILLARKKSK